MSVVSSELQTFLEEFIPDNIDAILESYSKPMPETFRINTIKISREECLSLLAEDGFEIKPIPYTEDGYYVSAGENLTTSLWHMLGYIYIQGPVSILVTELLDVEPGQIVLDLCAAPGSKSTHIAQKLNGKGVVVANDVSRTRIKALASNMQRCGVINGVITLNDGKTMGYKHRSFFDRVLVDAPCSSLGIGSKDWSVLRNWSQKTSERISKLQRSLLHSGYAALKPGGILLYSTCTFHPLENEAVVNSLLEKFPEAEVVLPHINNINYDKGLTEWKNMQFFPEVANTVRIFPYQSNAEGFFIAKIRKPGEKR